MIWYALCDSPYIGRLSYLKSLTTIKENNHTLCEVFVTKNRKFASHQAIRLCTFTIVQCTTTFSEN